MQLCYVRRKKVSLYPLSNPDKFEAVIILLSTEIDYFLVAYIMQT